MAVTVPPRRSRTAKANSNAPKSSGFGMADNEVRSSAPSVVMHVEAEVSGICFTRTTHFGCRFVTSLRIEESFDTSLGGFGKGVVLEFKLGHLRIGRKPSIQLLEIMLHDLL